MRKQAHERVCNRILFRQWYVQGLMGQCYLGKLGRALTLAIS